MKLVDKMTLLIVEDELLIAESKQKELESYGYNVLITNTGEKAVSLTRKNNGIDLILMDIDLGRGIDGTAAAEQILKERSIPIVFMSGHTEPDIVEKTEKVTSYGYVVKSSDITILDSSIKMALKMFHDSTEQLKTKAALTASLEKYRSIVENMIDGFYRTDSKGEIVLISPSVSKITGFSEEEIIGKEISSFYVNHDERKIFFEQIKKYGKVEAYEAEIIGKGKNKIIIEANAKIIYEDGEYAGIEGLFRNITERNRIAEEIRCKTEDSALINSLNNAINQGKSFHNILQLLTRRTKKIFSSSGGTLYLLSEDGKSLVMQNLTLPSTIKNSIEKLIGMRIPEVSIPLKAGSLHWDLLQKNKPQLINDPDTIQRLMSEYTENKILKKLIPDIYKVLGLNSVINIPLFSKGKAIGLLDLSRKEHFTELELIRIESISKQLTAIIEFKKNEVALEESEERYRTVVEGTKDLIIRIDLNGRIIFTNYMSQHFYGLTQEQCIGLSSFDFIYLDDLERTREWFQECIRKHLKHSSIENRQVNLKTKDIKDILWTCSFLYNDKGQLKYIDSIGRDITKRNIIEKKVKSLLGEKEVLLKEVHHRIKNNMYSIRSLLSLYTDKIKNPETVSVLNDTIARIDTMGVLYDKLYRTENNYNAVLVKEYMSQLIDEIVEMFPRNKKISIEKQMDNFSLNPKTIFPLGIIVNELITNAMKYAFTNRDNGIIKISVKKEANYVLLIFEDDGTGISEQEKKEGKGFGMTLIDMMITQIGGSYKIENIQGTKYIIEFENTVKNSL